jgi:RNA polymerase sigma factor (sigma-70 family)
MTPRQPVVFVVDDDAAVRDSVALFLGLCGYATRVFAGGDEFLSTVDSSSRGCVLLDLRMPGIDGLGVQAELAARGVSMPLVIITAHGDAATARATLKAGAFDFLEKPIDDAMLASVVGAALAHEAQARASTEQRDEVRARIARLTSRERQVLSRVVQGRHNREIAAELDISPRTVEVYKARVMDKLQVQRLPDLVRLTLDADLVLNGKP